ncbi:YbjN domain-containing protein [Thermus caldifontis]|uniref:YbjN domain-containing protein n=1 Tax=Thermus caldifontis TaxID=1930763 RepID=UPI001F08502A|nr:YbjN domain-containing protein [Thermus caldifontis]
MIKGLTPGEVKGLLKEMGVEYRPAGKDLFRLELNSMGPVWLELDVCEGGRCNLLILSAGFSRKVTLERINQWNRDYRQSRAYLDRDGNPWVEWELDLTEGVTRDAVKRFLRLFLEAVLPLFMEHIASRP